MTLVRIGRLVLLGTALAGPTAAAEVVPIPEQCAPSPEDSVGTGGSLPRVAAALRPGAAVDILVVGSAQVSEHAPGVVGFPQRMAEALEAAVPRLRVNLTVKGRHGATAGEMAEVIRDETAAKPYKLLLWQTGTVEAVQNTPPGDFTEALVEGVDAATGKGVDVLLVGPQYSHFLEAHADVEPYERALEEVAAMPDVALLPRFDLMRRWAESGQLDLERAEAAERRSTLDALHTCLGAYLARMALAGPRS